jgi:nickel superoxide dismutase
MTMKRCLLAGSTVATLALAVAAIAWLTHAPRAEAHCQVPCGIYDDPARIAQLLEDATTIEKAIGEINKLAGAHDATGMNQAIRWVTTKEDHATHVIDVVSEYFLTQKVKPVAPGATDYEKYLKQLADHHAVMVAAMKCKQDAAPGTVDTLRQAINELGHYYKK